MEETPRQTDDDEAPVSPDDVQAALEHSRKLQEEMATKSAKAEEAVSEMSKMLRRIAAAMERNPQSWDELFDGGRR